MNRHLPQLVPAVVLQVGSMDLAIPLRQVRRFVLAREISPLPGAPPALLGICVVAGKPTVAVDLFAVLEQPRHESWPPELGISGESEGTNLLLLGGRVRWVGRLRRASTEASGAAPLAGALEWRGSSLPLLAWHEVMGAVHDGGLI